jgi:GTP-binding protein
MFIDQAKIHVKAGQGGSGCSSFRREKFVPKGGPNGGDGGSGGSIILVATKNLHTLIDFKYKREYRAQRGQHGLGSNKHGKNGSDLLITVPVGTLVLDNNSGDIICDLVEDQQSIVVVEGGRGGKGNARFVTSTNRSPREWEVGEAGKECALRLELKLIADIGLVGLPNAGKSTLLSKISAAHPKIASYPFTTLQPHLGIVKYKDFHSYVVADIPGLIEGSHSGKGLGHQFLRHIERTRALAFLIDSTDEEPEKTLHILYKELNTFSEVLTTKPFIVVLTKNDLQEASKKITRFNNNHTVIIISSITGQNLGQLKEAFFKLLQKADVDENP